MAYRYLVTVTIRLHTAYLVTNYMSFFASVVSVIMFITSGFAMKRIGFVHIVFVNNCYVCCSYICISLSYSLLNGGFGYH